MASDTEMDELRRLSEAATPGDLNVSDMVDGWRHTICAGSTWRVIAQFERKEDAEFFAAAGRHLRSALSAPPAAQDGWREITGGDKIGRLRTRLLIARYPQSNGWTDAYTGWWDPKERKWIRWPHSFPPTHCMDVSVPADPPST